MSELAMEVSVKIILHKYQMVKINLIEDSSTYW